MTVCHFEDAKNQCFFLRFIRGNFELIMDDELLNRFFQLKLKDLLNDSTRPFPTCIFETERPEVIELVRRFCMFSPMMTTPFRVQDSFGYMPEGLECKPVMSYGELYVVLNLN